MRIIYTLLTTIRCKLNLENKMNNNRKLGIVNYENERKIRDRISKNKRLGFTDGRR